LQVVHLWRNKELRNLIEVIGYGLCAGVTQSGGLRKVETGVRCAHSATGRASGSNGGRLVRNANDENETIILLERDDLEKAWQFVQSADLRDVMQRAGVVESANNLPP
jgi:hypothetical protein